MGFMKPFADFMNMYHVETSTGTELVPEEVLTEVELHFYNNGEYLKAFASYIEGNQVYNVEMKQGWYARLSANGYMDRTDWEGPYDSEEKAIDEVKKLHQVDDNGDSTD